MPTPQHSIVFWAPPVVGAANIAIGDVLIPAADGSGYWHVSTSANRTTRGSEGVALSVGGGSGFGPVEIQQAGTLDATVSGLGAGAKQLVRTSSAGRLERIASYTSGDDVVGYAEADGRVHLHFGLPWAQIEALAGGGGSSVAAGDGVRVTTAGTVYTVHGVRGSSSPETFGAVGDGATNDSTAFTNAATAIDAGTVKVLELGARTYLADGVDLNADNWSIVGQGDVSIIRTALNRPIFKLLSAENTYVARCRLEGNGKATGNNLQRGVCSGYVGGDGASRVRCSDVTAYNMGDGGFVFQANPQIIGAALTNCRAYECALGFDCLTETTMSSCQAWRCTIGLRAAAGNVVWGQGDIIECTTGVKILAGGNDGHGIVSGANINHSTTAVDCGAISNGFTFDGCDIYQGDIVTNGNTGLLTFDHCRIDFTNLTNTNGKIRFLNCHFPTAYFVSATESGTGWTEFVNCTSDGGTLPSFISTRIQRAFTFASNANQTLTWQESVAATVIVATGVITASRQITSQWGPEVGRQVRIVNDNAQSVTFKWLTGTAVTVPTGTSALVGADGTNAKILDAKGSGGAPTTATYLTLSTDATLTNERVLTAGTNVSFVDGGANGALTINVAGGSGESNTASSSGGTASLVQTKSGVNLPFRGLSATSPIGVTQNANDCTIALSALIPVANGGTGVNSLGTTTRLLKNNGGVVGDTANVTHDGTGLLLHTSGYIGFTTAGSPPTNDGVLRLGNATTAVVTGRNFANTNDIHIVSWFGSSEFVYIGTDPFFTAAKQAVTTTVGATVGGTVQVVVGNVAIITATGSSTKIAHSTNGTRLDLQAIDIVHSGPIVALATATIPWSVHGDVGITMASANKTLTNAENARQELRFEGTFTAMHTVTITSASGLHGYTKDVWINATTDFGIVLTTGAGKTVSLKGTGTNDNVCRARVMVSANGVMAVSTMTWLQLAAISNQ